MGSSKVIRELKGHTSNITSLAYTCDSTLLASTSEDKTVKLWSMKAVLAHSGRYVKFFNDWSSYFFSVIVAIIRV